MTIIPDLIYVISFVGTTLRYGPYNMLDDWGDCLVEWLRTNAASQLPKHIREDYELRTKTPMKIELYEFDGDENNYILLSEYVFKFGKKRLFEYRAPLLYNFERTTVTYDILSLDGKTSAALHGRAIRRKVDIKPDSDLFELFDQIAEDIPNHPYTLITKERWHAVVDIFFDNQPYRRIEVTCMGEQAYMTEVTDEIQRTNDRPGDPGDED